MSDSELRRVSKGLALVLRHDAARLELTMDPEGFVPIAEVVAALVRMGIPASDALVRQVVGGVDVHKQRYSIVEDHIRANYGHSLERRIEHAPATPPRDLFHGTNVATTETILREGLLPMARQYVHLTIDRELARQVGARRGTPCVLRVDALSASADGIVFMRANEFFWLARSVPPRYLVVLA